jgi:hypothetical protein
VAALPLSGQYITNTLTWKKNSTKENADFYSAENRHQADYYLRFAVCKPDQALDLAKDRLRGLKKFLS